MQVSKLQVLKVQVSVLQVEDDVHVSKDWVTNVNETMKVP
jgi:hypothetical protein